MCEQDYSDAHVFEQIEQIYDDLSVSESETHHHQRAASSSSSWSYADPSERHSLRDD